MQSRGLRVFRGQCSGHESMHINSVVFQSSEKAIGGFVTFQCEARAIGNRLRQIIEARKTSGFSHRHAAQAKIKSWPFRKAVHIDSGNSISSIFIVKQFSSYPTGPPGESRRAFKLSPASRKPDVASDPTRVRSPSGGYGRPISVTPSAMHTCRDAPTRSGRHVRLPWANIGRLSNDPTLKK